LFAIVRHRAPASAVLRQVVPDGVGENILYLVVLYLLRGAVMSHKKEFWKIGLHCRARIFFFTPL
jgi:hypothetical protein